MIAGKLDEIPRHPLFGGGCNTGGIAGRNSAEDFRIALATTGGIP
jgi:hypothetical protein